MQSQDSALIVLLVLAILLVPALYEARKSNSYALVLVLGILMVSLFSTIVGV